MRSVFFGLVIMLVGCGGPAEKTATVSGTVLKGGKPFTFTNQGLPPGDKGFRLEFMQVSTSGPGLIFAADYLNDAGTFTIKPDRKQGLPVGTYKVMVHKGASGNPDELKGAFSKDTTPLKVEIPEGSINLEIDLDKKTITKK